MSNQYVNKVVYGNDTLIDLTGDNVSASDVAQGVTFHLPSGQQTVGTNTGGNGIASITTERVSVYDFYSSVPDDITENQTLPANSTHVWGDATLHVGSSDMQLQYRRSGDTFDGITYHSRLSFGTDGSPYISFTLSKALTLKLICYVQYFNANATLNIYNADTNTIIQSFTKTDFTNSVAVTNQLPAGNYKMSISYSSYTYVYFCGIKSTTVTNATRITITETNGTVTTFDIPDGEAGPAGPAGPAGQDGTDGAIIENTTPVHINVEASNWTNQLITEIPNNTIGTVIFVDANDNPVIMPIYDNLDPNVYTMSVSGQVSFKYHKVAFVVGTAGINYSKTENALLFSNGSVTCTICIGYDFISGSSMTPVLCTHYSSDQMLMNSAVDLLTLNNGFLGLNESIRQNGLQFCKIVYSRAHGAEIMPVVNSQDYPAYNLLALPKLTVNSINTDSIYTEDTCILAASAVDSNLLGHHVYNATARVFNSSGTQLGGRWNAEVKLMIAKFVDENDSHTTKTLIWLSCVIAPLEGLTMSQIQDITTLVGSDPIVTLNLPDRYSAPVR